MAVDRSGEKKVKNDSTPFSWCPHYVYDWIETGIMFKYASS